MASTNAITRAVDRKDFFGYQQIAGGGPLDFLNPVRQYTQITDSYAMWVKNPLAKFIIDIMMDFVWGDGVTFEAKDPIIQALLDDFYNDIDNDWKGEGEKRIQDLFIYGELFLKLFTSEFAGKVKVTSIFPGSVSNILINQENTEKIEAIKVKQHNKEEKEYKILTWNEQTESYEGEVLFFKINATVHQPRGLSDLFVRRDWLKLYDKSLYATMDRVGLLLSFVWDVTVDQAKEPELKKKRNKIITDPPKPGSIRVHNEKEVWKELSPTINGQDFDEIYRLLRSQGLAGIPEHFWGLGGNVNQATAKQMSEPFFAKARRRQRHIKNMFKQQFDYVIWVAEAKNMLSKVRDKSYALAMSDPDKQKASMFADTILKFANALTILETNGYIDTEIVDTVVSMLFELIGVDTSTGETQEDTETTTPGKEGEEGEDKKLINFYNKFKDRLKGAKKKGRKK